MGVISRPGGALNLILSSASPKNFPPLRGINKQYENNEHILFIDFFKLVVFTIETFYS
jgi:hypothetical protein